MSKYLHPSSYSVAPKDILVGFGTSKLTDLPVELFLKIIFRFVGFEEITRSIPCTSKLFFKIVLRFFTASKMSQSKFESILEERKVSDFWVSKILTEKRIKYWRMNKKSDYTSLRWMITCCKTGRKYTLFTLRKELPKKFDYVKCFQEASIQGQYRLVEQLWKQRSPKLELGKLFKLPGVSARVSRVERNLISVCYVSLDSPKIPNYLLKKAMENKFLNQEQIYRNIIVHLKNFSVRRYFHDETKRRFQKAMEEIMVVGYPELMKSLCGKDKKVGDVLYLFGKREVQVRLVESFGNDGIKICIMEEEDVPDHGYELYGDTKKEWQKVCDIFFTKTDCRRFIK